MINYINLRNFQSHKDSKLNFDKGVNVIVGSSDSGKSAILRALNWIIKNRPSGDDFRSYWGGATQAEIDINNKKIIRQKTDKKNLYKLDEEIYEAFGQDIPEEIKNTINFSDINFQYQMDAPFLLSKSSGEVAKYINEIINLEIIDKSLSNIEKTKREYNRKLGDERAFLKSNQEEIKKYNNLIEIEDKVLYAEELEKRLEDKKTKLNNLKYKIESIESINETIKKIKTTLDQEKIVDLLLKETKDLKEKKDKFQHLDDGLRNIDYCNNNITKINIEIERNEAKFKELMPEVCLLCGQKVDKDLL